MSGSSIGFGGPARRPAWASLLVPNPDYDNRKMVLMDSNSFISLIGRETQAQGSEVIDRWSEETSWMLNSPPSELVIKLNRTIHTELTQGRQGRTPPPDDVLRTQMAFIEAYRATGKIQLDFGPVPFFRSHRHSVFLDLMAALDQTRNFGEADQQIVCDGLVNRIRIFTGERRMKEGIEKAVRNGKVLAILRANGLARSLPEIVVPP